MTTLLRLGQKLKSPHFHRNRFFHPSPAQYSAVIEGSVAEDGGDSPLKIDSDLSRRHFETLVSIGSQTELPEWVEV